MSVVLYELQTFIIMIMKNMRNTLFLLFLSFICSCNADKQFQEFNDEFTKVTAILADWNLEDGESRTSITTGSYPTNPSPVWVTGDSIGIYPDAGGDQLSFRINEGGSKSCSFDGGGWAMKSSSYTAYSPFKRSFYFEEKDALPISMLGQTQNGNDNADHLGAYDIQIAKGEKPEEGSLIFDFDRYVALARLEITAPKAAKWSSITLESNALFTTEATMNLVEETPIVTPVKTSNSVTLELANVTTTNENLSIIAYMMLLPIDFTGKTLVVKLTDNNGVSYSSNTSIANDKTNFAANAARWISAEYMQEIIPNNQIWYTSNDGNIINPNNTTGFGANMISNDYENGKGIITFDSDVTTIKGSAFSNSNTLTSITIPNNVTIIESSAFYKCNSLKTVVFSNSLNIIREDAFAYCNSLENFTMPNSVTSIERGAFNGCSSLTNITIPHSVTSIGGNPFSWCSSLTNIIVEQGNSNYDSRNNCNAIIETASNTLISGCKNTIIPNDIVSISGAFSGCTSLTSITIPNSVSIITNSAFASCTSLTNITIPNSVTHILNNAFENCTSLTNITIPESVIEIGYAAFLHCVSLISVNVKATPPPSLDYTGFFDCNNYFIVYVPTESFEVYKKTDYWKNLNLSIETIPNNQIWYTSSVGNSIVTPYSTAGFGANIVSNVYENGIGIITFDNDVTTIGQSAFYNSSLRSITIPNSITEIKYNAFYNCSLESITIPNSVTNIGQGTFRNCRNLIYITIPDNVTEINSQMFSGCSSLVNITIPKNVTYIDIGVFDACNSLRRVDVKATTPPTLQDNVFAYCSNELKIYVPKESLEEYQNHFYWKQSNLFSDNQ